LALVSQISLTLELPAHFLDRPGQRAGFVCLIAFLVSYLFIRTSARLMRSPRVPWWPGSVVTDSGLHLHHLVWGILLLLVAGFLGFALDPGTPGREILAAMFGIGAGLTLDEFALWVHLEDVYWKEEGRSSFDAVVMATLVGGLLVLGFAPFDLPNNSSSVSTLAVAVIFDVLLAAFAILKGKPVLGMTGIFVPFVSLVGALRLASPGSPWARRLYAQDGDKLARSQMRWARIQSRRRRVQELVAGAPGGPVAADPPPAASSDRARDDPVRHE
jgi:hypothetical protein